MKTGEAAGGLEVFDGVRRVPVLGETVRPHVLAPALRTELTDGRQLFRPGFLLGLSPVPESRPAEGADRLSSAQPMCTGEAVWTQESRMRDAPGMH